MKIIEEWILSKLEHLIHTDRMVNKLIKNIKRIAAISVVLVFSSCSKFLNVPALPLEKTTISSELKYIHSTDQNDRKKGFIHIVFNTKQGKKVQERDGIRAERIFQLYQMDSLTNDGHKFTAGLVLMHSQDSIHKRTSYNIFNNLEINGQTEAGRKNGAIWKKLVY